MKVAGSVQSWRDLLAITWPMTLRMLMLHWIVVLDAWLVAALGEEAIAAMGLAGAVGGLVLGGLAAFANAAQILVARAYGARRASALQAGFVTGLVINLGVCLLGLVLMALLADPVLRGSAQSQLVLVEARRYLMVFSLVIIAEAFGQSLSAYFNGCGNTRVPFYSYLISLPINVVASYVLIHGLLGVPALGLAGAAIGSALAAFARTAYLLQALAKFRQLWPARRSWRAGISADLLRDHLAFSLPIAATFFSAQASSSICMLIYARYDIYQFAALTLILPWIHVAGALGMSWAQATGIAVAQHLGQGSRRAELDAFLLMAWRGVMIAAVLVSVLYLVVVLSAGVLYQALQPATRTALLTFLPTLLLLPWPKHSNAICGNTLRAAGYTVYVMHIFVWSQWLFKVPASAVLVFWLQAPVGWTLALLLIEELLKFLPFHWGLLRGRWREALPE